MRAHAAVVYKDSMYVVGGYLRNSHNNSLYKYNFGLCRFLRHVFIFVVSNTWTIVECTGDMPCERSRLSAVVHEDKMYVVGGTTGPARNVLLNDLYEFHFTTNVWKKVEIQGLEGGVSQHSLSVYKNQMLMFGGFLNGNASNELYGLRLSND